MRSHQRTEAKVQYRSRRAKFGAAIESLACGAPSGTGRFATSWRELSHCLAACRMSSAERGACTARKTARGGPLPAPPPAKWVRASVVADRRLQVNLHTTNITQNTGPGGGPPTTSAPQPTPPPTPATMTTAPPSPPPTATTAATAATMQPQQHQQPNTTTNNNDNTNNTNQH